MQKIPVAAVVYNLQMTLKNTAKMPRYAVYVTLWRNFFLEILVMHFLSVMKALVFAHNGFFNGRSKTQAVDVVEQYRQRIHASCLPKNCTQQRDRLLRKEESDCYIASWRHEFLRNSAVKLNKTGGYCMFNIYRV